MVKSDLRSGQYNIMNVGTRNSAQLATSNEKQKVQASAADGTDNFVVRII